MKNFREELFFGPFSGNSQQYRKVVLTTCDTSTHLNISPDHGKAGSDHMCISPTQAVQLRDALLKAYPLDVPKSAQSNPAGVFKVGDVVRRTRSGSTLLPVGSVGIVTAVDRNYQIKVDCDRGKEWRLAEFFEHASAAPAEPAINTELGRFIVAKMDNGNYLPGTKPRVHTSAKSANEEATRLANDHGGTFHVLRASFEASRPVVVQPPVKTAKL